MFMYRRRAILIALLCVLTPSAHAQDPVLFESCDHNWVIHYCSNQYGLKQDTLNDLSNHSINTTTTIYFGSYSRTFNTTVWPIVAIFFAVLSPVIWLITYGIGSVTRPAKKHPPPITSPP
jgi:hypothetical protein